MIRVTVELLPKGYEKWAKTLAIARISNDGTGTTEIGHYDIHLSKCDEPNATWRTGRVTDFPRNELGPWDLLLRALEECGVQGE
jgi:hypothetical protein